MRIKNLKNNNKLRKNKKIRDIHLLHNREYYSVENQNVLQFLRTNFKIIFETRPQIISNLNGRCTS